ncbi:hypothetical protein [Rhizobium sp. 007]|uniref:hypothetical protein n=1 Tax=Rhizobium sp. 007 TaxID=2785056 RepID=UPI001FEF10AA|nr:hypothetical protein [Rhizobium sp. 007]
MNAEIMKLLAVGDSLFIADVDLQQRGCSGLEFLCLTSCGLHAGFVQVLRVDSATVVAARHRGDVWLCLPFPAAASLADRLIVTSPRLEQIPVAMDMTGDSAPGYSDAIRNLPGG